MKVFLFSTIGADWDVSIVPFWVGHYLSLGIEPQNFWIVLQTRFDDDRNVENVREILASSGVVPRRVWRGIYSSQEMWRYRKQAIETIGEADWILVADSDEFHHYPDGVHRFLEKLDKARYYAVIGLLWDRIAADYRLRAIQPGVPIHEQFPVRTMYLTRRFMGMASTKIMSHKKAIIGNRGNHKVFRGDGPGETSGMMDARDARVLNPYGYDCWVDHFKWTDDILIKLEARLELYREKGYPWWTSYEKIIAYCREQGSLPRPGVAYRILDRLIRLRTRYSLRHAMPDRKVCPRCSKSTNHSD